MHLRANGIVFFGAAFPFVIPLVPSTDTQPTFSLLVLVGAAIIVARSFERRVTLQTGDLLLAVAVVGGGLAALGASLVVNGFATANINRIVAFLMLLIAIAAGLLNRSIFTPQRISLALKVYVVFTVLFFATSGALESLIIKTRGDEISQLLLRGRGASTLSPEPSFFAFQIFSLFLAARLTIWHGVSRRSRNLIQILTISLLILSFAGFGILYALMVILLAGRRYILGFILVGATGIAIFGNVSNFESTRFIHLFTILTDAIASGRLKLDDLSILGRLSSFQDYFAVFQANPLFGDAFGYYGGGGLVSLLAALGIFGFLFVSLVVVAILAVRSTIRLKLVLLAWLTFQFISGPVGLPMLGLMIGTVLRQSRMGSLLAAAGTLIRRRYDARRGAALSPEPRLG